MRQVDISIVIPLYNEEKVIPLLVQELDRFNESFQPNLEIILVDDGSKDDTPNLISSLALKQPEYSCVILSRNFGHQYAITAGMSIVKGTVGVVIMDGDLQDPPELINRFYENFKNGYDISYGVRTIQKQEGILKKYLSLYFYKILKKFSNIEIPRNSGDFCFLSRRVVNIYNKMPEESRFLRGIRAWVGFKSKEELFIRPSRVAGEPKFTFKKLFQLAYNGIFNFSELPVRFIFILGVMAVIVSVSYFMYTLGKVILGIEVQEGFLGMLFVFILFCGVQLIALGVIGEYVLRIFFQVKNRPLFIISTKIQDGEVVDQVT